MTYDNKPRVSQKTEFKYTTTYIIYMNYIVYKLFNRVNKFKEKNLQLH